MTSLWYVLSFEAGALVNFMTGYLAVNRGLFRLLSDIIRVDHGVIESNPHLPHTWLFVFLFYLVSKPGMKLYLSRIVHWGTSSDIFSWSEVEVLCHCSCISSHFLFWILFFKWSARIHFLKQCYVVYCYNLFHEGCSSPLIFWGPNIGMVIGRVWHNYILWMFTGFHLFSDFNTNSC
jgi:hypothetical protein